MKFNKNYLNTIGIAVLTGIATTTLLVRASETNTPPASCSMHAKKAVAKPSGCPMHKASVAPATSEKTPAAGCGQRESGCCAKKASLPAAGCGHESAAPAPTTNP